MSFAVPAEAYGRFMGRFSEPLAPLFADLVGVAPPQRAVDVGCGPGALTEVLARRLGAEQVAAVDPSEPFVTAARERLPGVDVRLGGAEALPFDDGAFDVALAQLVVHFMADPVSGLREMARVTRESGVVAACVWDHGGGTGPLSSFWRAARRLDPAVSGEGELRGSYEGDLVRLAQDAGLHQPEQSRIAVRVHFPDFDDWWQPFTLGVGPAGQYVGSLDERAREALRARCHADLGDSFDIEASAWTVAAHA